MTETTTTQAGSERQTSAPQKPQREGSGGTHTILRKMSGGYSAQASALSPMGGVLSLSRQPGAAGLPGDAASTAVAGLSGSSSAIPYRAEMESRFGADFSSVQAYSGSAAGAACDALGANAYAVGDKVAFGSSSPDRGLVAHELTHVVQHRASGGAGAVASGAVSTRGSAAEREADAVESAVRSGGPMPAISAPIGAGAILRDEKGEEPLADAATKNRAINFVIRSIEGPKGTPLEGTKLDVKAQFTVEADAADGQATFTAGRERDFTSTAAKQAKTKYEAKLLGAGWPDAFEITEWLQVQLKLIDVNLAPTIEQEATLGKDPGLSLGYIAMSLNGKLKGSTFFKDIEGIEDPPYDWAFKAKIEAKAKATPEILKNLAKRAGRKVDDAKVALKERELKVREESLAQREQMLEDAKEGKAGAWSESRAKSLEASLEVERFTTKYEQETLEYLKAERELEAKRATLSDTVGKAQQADERAKAAEARIEQLQKEQLEVETKGDETKSAKIELELSQLEDEVEDQKTKAKELRADAGELEEAIDSDAAALSEKKSSLTTSLEAGLVDVEERLATWDEAHAEKRAELDARVKELEALEELSDEDHKELYDKRTQLEDLDRDRGVLERQRSTLKSQVSEANELDARAYKVTRAEERAKSADAIEDKRKAWDAHNDKQPGRADVDPDLKAKKLEERKAYNEEWGKRADDWEQRKGGGAWGPERAKEIKARIALDEFSMPYEEATLEVQKAEKELKAKQERAASLQSQIDAAEGDTDKLQAELDALNDEIESDSKAFADKKAEVQGKLDQGIADLDAKLEAFDENKAPRIAEIDKELAELELTGALDDEEQSKLQALKDEKAALEGERETLEKKRSRLSNEVNTLTWADENAKLKQAYFDEVDKQVSHLQDLDAEAEKKGWKAKAGASDADEAISKAYKERIEAQAETMRAHYEDTLSKYDESLTKYMDEDLAGKVDKDTIKATFIDESMAQLKEVRPDLTDDELKAARQKLDAAFDASFAKHGDAKDLEAAKAAFKSQATEAFTDGMLKKGGAATQTAWGKRAMVKLARTGGKALPVIGWGLDLAAVAMDIHNAHEAYKKGDMWEMGWEIFHAVTDALGFIPVVGDIIAIVGDVIYETREVWELMYREGPDVVLSNMWEKIKEDVSKSFEERMEEYGKPTAPSAGGDLSLEDSEGPVGGGGKPDEEGGGEPGGEPGDKSGPKGEGDSGQVPGGTEGEDLEGDKAEGVKTNIDQVEPSGEDGSQVMITDDDASVLVSADGQSLVMKVDIATYGGMSHFRAPGEKMSVTLDGEKAWFKLAQVDPGMFEVTLTFERVEAPADKSDDAEADEATEAAPIDYTRVGLENVYWSEEIGWEAGDFSRGTSSDAGSKAFADWVLTFQTDHNITPEGTAGPVTTLKRYADAPEAAVIVARAEALITDEESSEPDPEGVPGKSEGEPGEGEKTEGGEGDKTGGGEGENTESGESQKTGSGEGDKTGSGEGDKTGSGEGDKTGSGEGQKTGGGSNDVTEGTGELTGEVAGDADGVVEEPQGESGDEPLPEGEEVSATGLLPSPPFFLLAVNGDAITIDEAKLEEIKSGGFTLASGLQVQILDLSISTRADGSLIHIDSVTTVKILAGNEAYATGSVHPVSHHFFWDTTAEDFGSFQDSGFSSALGALVESTSEGAQLKSGVEGKTHQLGPLSATVVKIVSSEPVQIDEERTGQKVIVQIVPTDLGGMSGIVDAYGNYVRFEIGTAVDVALYYVNTPV